MKLFIFFALLLLISILITINCLIRSPNNRFCCKFNNAHGKKNGCWILTSVRWGQWGIKRIDDPSKAEWTAHSSQLMNKRSRLQQTINNNDKALGAKCPDAFNSPGMCKIIIIIRNHNLWPLNRCEIALPRKIKLYDSPIFLPVQSGLTTTKIQLTLKDTFLAKKNWKLSQVCVSDLLTRFHKKKTRWKFLIRNFVVFSTLERT